MRISRINARVPLLISVVVATLSLGSVAQCAESVMDTATIERLTGEKGTLDEKEGVFKVSAPRKDLSVTIAGRENDAADGAHVVGSLQAR